VTVLSGAGAIMGDTREYASSLPLQFPRHLIARYLTSLLVFLQPYESRMPKMVVWSPFGEFELTHKLRIQPSTIAHLRRRESLTPPPLLASGRFTNGHFSVSKP
jgi:hypothetical protein